MKYEIPLSFIGFMFIAKINILLSSFIIIYFYDTGRTEEMYRSLYDLAVGGWFWIAIILYILFDVILDIKKKKEREGEE